MSAQQQQGKVVLVTGATAGIGRFVALDLASRGHRVFATGRNVEALESLRQEAYARGTSLATLVLDVTSAASVASAATALRELTGGHGVDVLVNNAGYGQGGPMLDVDDASLRQQFDTNVFGLMEVTRAFAPEMLARREGWVINVSSIGGRVTFPFFGAYHASKYALEAISNALRLELREFGVRVVLVEPGPITSEFSNRAFGSLPQGQAAARYSTAYGMADDLHKTTDRFSFGPQHVARAVRKAMSPNPSARYLAPSFLWFMLALFSFLPTRLLDAVFRASFGLKNAVPQPEPPALTSSQAT